MGWAWLSERGVLLRYGPWIAIVPSSAVPYKAPKRLQPL